MPNYSRQEISWKKHKPQGLINEKKYIYKGERKKG